MFMEVFKSLRRKQDAHKFKPGIHVKLKGNGKECHIFMRYGYVTEGGVRKPYYLVAHKGEKSRINYVGVAEDEIEKEVRDSVRFFWCF